MKHEDAQSQKSKLNHGPYLIYSWSLSELTENHFEDKLKHVFKNDPIYFAQLQISYESYN